MINMTDNMIYRLGNLNKENTRISYQMSTGKLLDRGSDDSKIYARELYLSDKLYTYEGLKTQIEKTTAQNNVADVSVSEMKTIMDDIKSEILKALNAGMDRSDKKSIAVSLKGMRENLLTRATDTVDGEYLFSGSDTTIRPFTKSDDFETTGKIDYNGDAILRSIAVEPNVYRDRGIHGFDMMMYSTDKAIEGEKLSFTQQERIIDESGLEWSLTKATTGNKLTFDVDDAILDDNGDAWVLDTTTMKLVNQVDNNITLDVVKVDGNQYRTASISGNQGDGTTPLGFLAVDSDSDGDIDAADLKIRQFDKNGSLTGAPDGEISITETAGSPNQYETTSTLSTPGMVLEAKHNFFDDLQEIIKALEGYKDNDGDPATTDYVEISDDDVNDILRNSLDKVGSAYDAINIAHSKLGARNKIFENANEGVVSKITHYTILLQEVGGADLSKVAMEAQALEMTYSALYSTIAKMNDLSLVNFIR